MAITTFTEPITINAPGKSVVFDGCDFTKDAYIKVLAVDELIFKNCRVYALTPAITNKYFLHITGDIALKLVIENNFFGNNAGGGNNVYNLIEPTAYLKDGSSFSNNYFALGCCSHNPISIYGVEDDATVNVNGNYLAESSGDIRLGMRGTPKCVINLKDNTIKARHSTDSEEWDGLITIQPYGTKTETFANCTLYIDNTKMPYTQLLFGYPGNKNSPFTEEMLPKIYVDGVRFMDTPILG